MNNYYSAYQRKKIKFLFSIIFIEVYNNKKLLRKPHKTTIIEDPIFIFDE